MQDIREKLADEKNIAEWGGADGKIFGIGEEFGRERSCFMQHAKNLNSTGREIRKFDKMFDEGELF